MRIRRILALLLAALLLAGCSAKSADSVTYQMADAEANAALDSVIYGESGSVSGQELSDRKLIKRASISAETEDLDALLSWLNGKVTQLGGYIESQQLSNGSAYSSYRSRSANLTVRIPAEHLPDFVEQVGGASNVVSYSESQDDVTLTYVDTASRVKALETEQDRLLELMEQAETMSDLLEIEQRLTEVRYELESVASQLRVLENQVDYATVELYVSQVKVYTEVEEQTVWQRIGSGFTGNLRAIGTGLVDFFVWVITYSPQLILLSAAAAVVVWLWRRRRGKRRGTKAPRTEDTP